MANPFKQALRAGRTQVGLWMGLASAQAAEICACSGVDWLLIDAEHAPNDLQTILAQLHAVQGYDAHPIARVPHGHGAAGAALIKQYLDLGVQTLMVPMVDTAEQAAALVRAVRYPPDGIRGMAPSRAARWGHWKTYPQQANESTCLIVQVESLEGLRQLEAIATTEGVDGVFIGPGDLSAEMGHVGDSGHDAVRAVVRNAIGRVVACGKAAGTMSAVREDFAREYMAAGATFIAVGFDAMLLAGGTTGMVRKFKPE